MFLNNRKDGISLLVPTQNSEKTIELCIKSFKNFADEIIIVDNGSNDNTIDIAKKLNKNFSKIRFFNKPELVDLYQNRQFAFEQSRYNWIVRIDSDYIAYTEGEYDIKNLRKIILNTKRTIIPKAFSIFHVTVFKDFFHTGIPRENRREVAGRHVQPPTATLPARIIQYFPGLKFKRLGRWEGVRFQKYLKKIQLKKPYWMHCQIKSDMDFFYRSERTNWRELGDYDKFPTLEEYIKHIIPYKYGTTDIKEACEIYMERHVIPYLTEYNPDKYYPYPKIIQGEVIEKR